MIRDQNRRPRRIAFYGGSFDPLHIGHLTIATKLIGLFRLDQLVFIPAFHAPHKKRLKPTPAIHRYAMLAVATNDNPEISISTIELESPERPYTFETLGRLKAELPNDRIFFVIGADSWAEIDTWREWERVLTMSSHIVVTRPGYEIGSSHVTDEIRRRIIDVRDASGAPAMDDGEDKIYVTDVVNLDISATGIREDIRSGGYGWRNEVPIEVAKYIEKYQIYT